MRRYDRYRKHVSREGTRTLDSATGGGKVTYDVYTCDHCDEEFLYEPIRKWADLFSRVKDHLEKEHPEELERETYPNEEIFREWADRIDRRVQEPDEPGDPLLVRHSEGNVVKMYADGTIAMEATKILGGGNSDQEVSLRGKRLTVERTHRTNYVSDKAFPI